jgi:FKBP-type peptidyl-prolyl cis-trans isomerase 2
MHFDLFGARRHRPGGRQVDTEGLEVHDVVGDELVVPQNHRLAGQTSTTVVDTLDAGRRLGSARARW